MFQNTLTVTAISVCERDDGWHVCNRSLDWEGFVTDVPISGPYTEAVANRIARETAEAQGEAERERKRLAASRNRSKANEKRPATEGQKRHLVRAINRLTEAVSLHMEEIE